MGKGKSHTFWYTPYAWESERGDYKVGCARQFSSKGIEESQSVSSSRLTSPREEEMRTESTWREWRTNGHMWNVCDIRNGGVLFPFFFFFCLPSSLGPIGKGRSRREKNSVL